MKPGYKQTEVGVIPEDWNVCNLEDAVEFLDGQRKPIKSSDRARIQGAYPYYGASGIVDYVNGYIFDEELILLGEDGENILSRNLPLAFRVSGKIWVNNHAHVMRPRKTFSIGYLTEFLESRDYSLLNSGTAQPKLNKQTCLKIKIAQPTKTEQTAIANALSDADALIQSLTRLIAKKRQIKQGTMQTLLNPYENGRLKAGWKEKKLGEIGVFRGGSGFPTRYQGKAEGLYPFYKVSDMNNEGNEKLMINANNWIDEKVKKEIGAITFPRNTIIFAKIGAAIFLERKKILNQESCIDNNMMGYVFDTNLYNVEYLHYLFQTIQLGKLVSTTALPSLNGKEISAQKYYFPNKLEQNLIATNLSDMDTEIAALETKLAKYRHIKQGMMQNLLTGRIRLI